jgi:peptidoglycan/xylan/chitin deacetylase (PgdA/CDA1 family)
VNKFNYTFVFLLTLFCFQANALVVLQYHHISDTTPKITSLSAELFKQHLDYLDRHDFNVVSMSHAIELLKAKKALPEKTVLITFDDGYRSIYDTALPMLKEKNYPFTVFVSTNSINLKLKQFMSWDEIKELTQHQATIANHTVTHPYLIHRQDNENEAQWEARVTSEILEGQSHIDNNVGEQIKVFAYPYGEFNLSLKAILSKLNYISFGQHSGAILNESDLQELPRFPFSGNYGGIDDFITKVNSIALPIKTIHLFDENNNKLLDQQIKRNIKRPKLFIRLNKESSELGLQCYFSPEGQMKKVAVDGGWMFQPVSELPIGRSRYNCTAQSEAPLKVYWFSQPWIRP